eukprot:CAMPEP_0117041350 /NCGR_PEP_ID=MMETSP0472-20121206/28887_1 /TAXON_ID=693140 ORGANISM="Tiarina fusus, Strain LIS" /NCGR_SAMPLE_ID=MMETSP0472 /ASSEMBLY_ACC=CAM_ASM_000603 /LENGTH=138 /DNA_ID=CAMNT_0004752345 /DNA_START=23 /DNA_END=439 /DNA_ORIENTATION=+
MARPEVIPIVVSCCALVALSSILYVANQAPSETELTQMLTWYPTPSEPGGYQWAGPGKNYAASTSEDIFGNSEHDWTAGQGKDYEDEPLYDETYKHTWKNDVGYESELTISDPETYSWNKDSSNWQPPDQLGGSGANF